MTIMRMLSTGFAVLAAALLAACDKPAEPVYNGYAEGEYVRVSSAVAGSVARLQVRRGDAVAAGAPLYTLESENERAARGEAQARVAQAQAQLDDLRKGKRPEEVEAVRSQRAQAQAALALSSADLKRQRELVAAKFVSPARVDEALAAERRDRAKVRELSAQLQVASLAARPDAIAAAQAELAAAREALSQADWRLAQKAQTAPKAAAVIDTLYREGEWVPAGSPVVSLLPPENIKARFYVPEARLAAVRVGDQVQVRCDGCGEPIAAAVSFIAPQAEYTPPVIYSKENRANLVFLVEARPEPAQATRLKPGQPIEARLASEARP